MSSLETEISASAGFDFVVPVDLAFCFFALPSAPKKGKKEKNGRGVGGDC